MASETEDRRGNLERTRTVEERATYSVRQIAQWLCRSEKYVRRALRRGDLRGRRDRSGYRIVGRDALAFVSGSWDGLGEGAR